MTTDHISQSVLSTSLNKVTIRLSLRQQIHLQQHHHIFSFFSHFFLFWSMLMYEIHVQSNVHTIFTPHWSILNFIHKSSSLKSHNLKLMTHISDHTFCNTEKHKKYTICYKRHFNNKFFILWFPFFLFVFLTV